MKNLRYKVIIYDDVCPLCKAYTSGFVAVGWLLPQNRIGFSEAPASILDRIDIDRARHEIPLHDTQTGETLYGKDALFFILGEAMPIFKPLFRWVPFRAIIFVLYQIITYNRRIIVGSRTPIKGFDCAPDFNLFYRGLYIFWAVATAVLFFIFTTPLPPLPFQIVFSSMIAGGVLRCMLFEGIERKASSLGHFATVLLIAAIIARLLGWNEYTIVLVPSISAFLFAKRVEHLVA